MGSQSIPLRTIYKAILADARKDATRSKSTRPKRDYVKAADEFRKAKRLSWAFSILSPLKDRFANDAYFNFVFALVCRDLQDMESAHSHSSIASNLAPDNPDIAFAKAQFAFETWRPSIDLFEQALELAPDNLTLLKNLAQACASEGQTVQGRRLLRTAVDSFPDWIEGHRALVNINVTSGESKPFDDLAESCELAPGNLDKQLAFFYLLAQAKQWDEAGAALEAIPAFQRQENRFLMSSAYLRAETGGKLSEQELTGTISELGDPGFDLCRTRYFLRTGFPKCAEEIAQKHLSGPHSRLFWPYLSLCWRITNNPRADWLEASGDFVSVVDLGLDEVYLGELRSEIGNLHTFGKPYLEQSVKGGTQTNRNIFFNPNPRIQKLRGTVTNTVKRYVNALTASQDGHPLLSCVPDSIRYSGAWSVALSKNGYHTPHTHVQGWLSSALYISIPPNEDLGQPPAGNLTLGAPPSELGLELGATRHVKPGNGQLVLFPSYTWHGTAPFQSGERLTIAFDVSPA